jgi:hypothetical protein
MTSNTCYLSVYRVASALPCFNCASLVAYKRLAAPVFDFGYEGSALLYSYLVDLIYYG